MQVTAFFSAALAKATRPQGGDVAALLRADTFLQGQQQAVALANLRETTLNNPNAAGPLTTGRKRSAAEVERSQDQMAKWGRALQRLMMGQGRVTGQAAALVAGQASSATGVAVAITAERVNGVYTDWKAGLGPQPHYNDAALADTVSITAEEVDEVYTAGGSDAVSINARRVSGVSTGNDADSLTIVANLVERVHTDEGVPWGRDAGDAVAIVADLVLGVSTGGGDDAIAITAGTVVGVDGGSGDDAISVLANVVAGIHGGDGHDVMSVDARVGRRDDMFDAQSLIRNSYTPTDLTDRMVWVTGLQAQVGGGAGDDAIAVRVEGTIGVSGGTGDDSIALQGGTVGLFYDIGDGHDSVTLAPGTEAVVQINGASGYSVEQGQDSLTLRIGAGSITFAGLSQSGAIGVQFGVGRGVVLVHGGTGGLNRTV